VADIVDAYERHAAHAETKGRPEPTADTAL